MPEERAGEWYTNRDLFEMIQSLRGEMTALSAELARTTEAVRRYNGLRERLDALEARAAGAASVGRGIREWGGWLVAIGSLAVAVVSLMRR